MAKSLIAAALLVCGAALCAQGPAGKAKAAGVQGQAEHQEQASAQARKTPKAAEQDVEESVVMIDSKGDPDDAGTPASYREEKDEVPVPGGLPSSYGQCKGVMNDAGRTILVFESPDDGTVSFVQVTLGKGKVSWKLIDRILRSAD